MTVLLPVLAALAALWALFLILCQDKHVHRGARTYWKLGNAFNRCNTALRHLNITLRANRELSARATGCDTATRVREDGRR